MGHITKGGRPVLVPGLSFANPPGSNKLPQSPAARERYVTVFPIMGNVTVASLQIFPRPTFE